MVSMLYACLLLLTFDVTSLAERSERLDHGDLSLSDVNESLTACKELIWDSETIKRRKRRGMEVGKTGHIVEERLLGCLTELDFKAFPAEEFHPFKAKDRKFVENPEECLPDGGPVTLSVWNPSNEDGHHAPRSLPAPISLMTNFAPSTSFACLHYPSERELRDCFDGHLPHGEEPFEFDGENIYYTSAVFIKFA